MSISSANAVGVPTRKVVTLTSGTSWTVPAKVTYVNAKLFGGGGAGNGNITSGSYYVSGDGASGQVIETTVTTTPGASIAYSIGAGGTANGGAGGSTTFTGATTAAGGNGGGGAGAVGTAGEGANNYGVGGTAYNAGGGNGGAGKITLEYWIA